jgi:hypothetical protein
MPLARRGFLALDAGDFLGHLGLPIGGQELRLGDALVYGHEIELSF